MPKAFILCSLALLVPLAVVGQSTGPCVGGVCQPVVYVPGMFSSLMAFHVAADAPLPDYCPKNTTLLWPSDLYPYWASSVECPYRIMRIAYDEATGKGSDTLGVTSELPSFGKMASANILFGGYLNPLIQAFQSWGYTVDKDLVALPFDWRRAPDDIAADHKWVAEAVKLIEKTVNSSHGRAVHLISHSNGSPTALALLNALPRHWVARNIASHVSLSGDFIGSSVLESVSFQAADNWDRELSLSWPAYAWSMPDPRFFPHRTFVETPDSGAFSISETPLFFERVAEGSENYPLFGRMLRRSWCQHNRAIMPRGVDVHCMLGTNISVNIAYKFSSNDLTQQPSNITVDTNGDGNQEYIDNISCELLGRQARVSGSKFTTTQFPGVNHQALPSTQAVLDRMKAILSSYN